MASVDQVFNKGFFTILALTALLCLAGIVLLPGIGPTYADHPEAQTGQVDWPVPSVNHNTWTTLAPMPTAALANGAAVYKGQLCCFGGWTAYQGAILNSVQLYQP